MCFKIVEEPCRNPCKQPLKYVAYERFFFFFWNEIGEFDTLKDAQEICQGIAATCLKPKTPVHYGNRGLNNKLQWELTEE